MQTPEGDRKRIKHYDDPGDCHVLAFSCYRRKPLLTNDVWREMLSEGITRASARRLLLDLTIRQRPGVNTFRFWQEGSGYDRNLHSAAAIDAAMEYIHMNPVRRGLCERAVDWRWSSARYYLDDDYHPDPALPALEPLPFDYRLDLDA
jgi:putative transposase